MKQLFNQALRILVVTNGLVLVAGAMLGPIYALFVERIGGDLLDASYAFSAFALAAGVTTFVSGRFSDKMKENELIIVLGYVIIGAGFLSYLAVSSVWQLLIVQVLIGLGEAIYAPAFDALYSKHLDGHKFGREWGAYEGVNYITTASGAIIGGVVATYVGFSILFVLMALLCFFAAGYIFMTPRRVL